MGWETGHEKAELSEQKNYFANVLSPKLFFFVALAFGCRVIRWVIVNSGLSEYVGRRVFPKISKAFLNLESAVLIVENRDLCHRNAVKCFRHLGKVGAIVAISEHLARLGFDAVRNALLKNGPKYLQRFPYLGPTTSLHLAKNLGLSVAKPDRHLCRTSSRYGFSSVNAFCSLVAQYSGDPISVVDIVWWRYAVITRTH